MQEPQQAAVNSDIPRSSRTTPGKRKFRKGARGTRRSMYGRGHCSLRFPFHLLQQDYEINFQYPLPDIHDKSRTDAALPQDAAREWIRDNPVRTKANEDLPLLFMNKSPARTYDEMTTGLLSTTAYGERAPDPRFESYLRHAMFARQCMWDALAREQCAQLLQSGNLEHSMVFAPVYPSDPDIRILVHDFHIRLLHGKKKLNDAATDSAGVVIMAMASPD